MAKRKKPVEPVPEVEVSSLVIEEAPATSPLKFWPILKPNELDPDYRTDSSGHYLLAVHDQIQGRGDLAPEDKNKLLAKLSFPLFGYRPLPAARKFHRSSSRFKYALGGNRCLGPDTLIESPNGSINRVADIKGQHEVWAWDGKKQVKAIASEPWIKGYEPCYRIHLSNGQWFDCSLQHRILSNSKRFIEAGFFYKHSSRIPLFSPGNKPVEVLNYNFIGIKPIYDFEVPVYNNYVTRGVVHHNSSKSQTLAVDTVWKATGLHPYRRDLKVPCLIWYATTTFDKVTDTLWEKLDPLKGGLLLGIPHEVVWRSRQYNIPSHVNIPVNGGVSQIYFKAYEQGRESFQAAAIDYASYDEQFDQNIFIETISRIGSGKKLEFSCAFTPIDHQPWMEDRMEKDPEGVFHFSLDDNRLSWGGFIEDAEIDATIEQWPPEVRECRRHGKSGGYVGVVFKTFNKNIHVIDEVKEQLFFKNGFPSPDDAVIFGIDWGGANPFVCIFACKLHAWDDTLYIFDELYWDHEKQGGRLLSQLSEDIKQRTLKWQTRLVRGYADHDPTNALEFANLGIHTLPADKKDIPITIEYLQSLFMIRPHLADSFWPMGRPMIFIAKRCVNLIRELSIYRYPPGTDGKNPQDRPIDKDNHAVDATRYLSYSDRDYSTQAPIDIDIGGQKKYLF